MNFISLIFVGLQVLLSRIIILFFDGKLYDQIDGVAMGSPLRLSLVNMVLCYLERKFLDDCPWQFKPIIYHRYVDGAFCLFKNKEHADLFLITLTNIIATFGLL